MAAPASSFYDDDHSLTSPPSSSRSTSPTSTPAPFFDPPVTFSTVIEDDHQGINKYAARLLKARTPKERCHLLHQVTWRLVRHDVSEDLIMRPAFVAQLGEEGERMAEHDRSDHEKAKQELLALFASPSLDNEEEFSQKIRGLFAELLEHMRVESGEQIPNLERILDPEESQRLGREYMKTMVITPDLEMVDKSLSTEHGHAQPKKRRVWRDIEDFARTDLKRFREIWAELTGEEVAEGVKAYYNTYARGRL